MSKLKFLTSLAFVGALAGASLTFMVESSAFAKPKETKRAGAAEKTADPAQPTVNHDDPNLAFTAEYASDSATACPKALHGKKLRECLLRLGVVGGEEVSEQTESLSDVSPRSVH